MNPDKRIIIDDLTARVNASPFLIVVDYTSITVPEFTNLRSALAACGAQCHVAKNNFMRTALTDAGLPDIGEHLVGQTAFVTGASDVAGAAKAIEALDGKDFGGRTLRVNKAKERAPRPPRRY